MKANTEVRPTKMFLQDIDDFGKKYSYLPSKPTKDSVYTVKRVYNVNGVILGVQECVELEDLEVKDEKGNVIPLNSTLFIPVGQEEEDKCYDLITA